jgi:epoxyqueuosine reductase
MSEQAMSDFKTAIRERAQELGFDVVGFTTAEADPADARALARFLGEGRHGDMAWLDNADGRRGNPKSLMPEAKTIIVLGANYGPAAGVPEIPGSGRGRCPGTVVLADRDQSRPHERG